MCGRASCPLLNGWLHMAQGRQALRCKEADYKAFFYDIAEVFCCPLHIPSCATSVRVVPPQARDTALAMHTATKAASGP